MNHGSAFSGALRTRDTKGCGTQDFLFHDYFTKLNLSKVLLGVTQT
jgi:hypothetical protein